MVHQMCVYHFGAIGTKIGTIGTIWQGGTIWHQIFVNLITSRISGFWIIYIKWTVVSWTRRTSCQFILRSLTLAPRWLLLYPNGGWLRLCSIIILCLLAGWLYSCLPCIDWALLCFAALCVGCLVFTLPSSIEPATCMPSAAWAIFAVFTRFPLSAGCLGRSIIMLNVGSGRVGIASILAWI